jgi:hypothetical protein
MGPVTPIVIMVTPRSQNMRGANAVPPPV